MIVEPFVDLFLVDIVMYRCIVQDDNDRLAIYVLECQFMNKFNHLWTFDSRFMQRVHDSIGTIVERAKNVYALARTTGVGAMRLTQRGPCTLYIGDGRHPGFVKKIQMRNVLLGRDFQFFEHDSLRDELVFYSFFLRDRRQRLKLI